MPIGSIPQAAVEFILWLIAILVALSVHEFAHALAATLLGDLTAKRMGRLTLNPFAHVDAVGLFGLIFAHFGWGKPVPFDPRKLRFGNWGSVIVAFAGPVMNFFNALIAAILIHWFVPGLGSANLLIQFLLIYFIINILLMVFNFIPIPPLDGSKLLMTIFDTLGWFEAKAWIDRNGPYLLLGIIASEFLLNIGILRAVLDPPMAFMVQIMGLGMYLGL